MSDISVIVEGPTEQKFIKEILAPELAPKNIFLTATTLRKPGENGGDVKFSRVKNHIGKFLKQRADTCVTLMLDYYGIHETKTDVWPGYKDSTQQPAHSQKHSFLIEATKAEIVRLFPPKYNPQSRFIPYFSMHEIEALYFSNTTILAQTTDIKEKKITGILRECGEPENINNNRNTAPSKRLEALCPSFQKTSTGLAIAQAIGISAMRTACPLFNAWITQMENMR
ncbi:MAG: DUF4276 family protein [Puniceicoccales bacterium]|jgi:hypothetical protein|nr:DUF4276 family protein [Puniceicoccales bacterium]